MYTLILVDYNSIECTVSFMRQCIDNIKTELPLHTVLVDNGNCKDNLEYLRTQFKSCQALADPFEGRHLYRLADDHVDLIYCHSGDNIGYAKGNNLAARIADFIFGDPYYILSNNDILFPEPIDLQQITAHFTANPKMALLGPKVVDTIGIPQTPRKRQSAFTKLIAWYWGIGPLRKYVDDVDYNASAGPCEWVTGCFFFVRKDAFAAVSGFDENTFLYAEEMIISSRLRKQGYTTVYDPFLTIIHNHREAYKTVSQALRIIRISFESNSYYYKTYRDTSSALLFLSRVSFSLYRLLYPLWQLFKKKH